MTISNILLTALRGVSANKLRSALTMLGVIIGVASVIAMLALGNGARAAVGASFRFLGADQVQIRQNIEFEDGEMVAIGDILSYTDGLLMADALEEVERVSMSVSRAVKARQGRVVIDMNVAGTDAGALDELVSGGTVQPVDWPEGEPLTADSFLAQGRFFTPAEVQEGANVCVLGQQTAEDLFGGDDPLGQIVRINREKYMVVGVLTELEATDPDERRFSKPNEAIYLPISAAIRDLYDEEPSVNMTAYVRDEQRMDEAKAEIANYLRQRHEIEPDEEGIYEDDFTLTTRDDILGVQQEAASTFSLLLAAMAAVSLVVGGIGIMNVMLVSVTERTREIGTRLAVGAQQRDIAGQFLLEAVIISAVGGGLGVAVGILTIPLAALLNRGMALLLPGSIPLALTIAVLIGVLFGLYPALRAARLEPIEALRYE